VEVKLHDLLEFGLDGVVPFEYEGFDLALSARAFVRRCQGFAKTLTNMVNESRSQGEQVEFLRDCIHGILWEYLRARVAPCIPPVDYNIPAGEVVQMHQYQFTQLLGKGAYGSVYRIQDQTQPQSALVGECMKVVNKDSVTSINDLKSAKRGIEVMKLISSAQHRHPNVVQTYDMYHSQTHIFFRMEYAGPENLFRRLAHRQKDPPQTRPISVAIARAMLVQAIDGVTHLHLSPSVCHRDIKPENFVVLESNGAIIVKLADFDLALHCPRDTLLRSPCGTFPFTAPEVMVEREYNGFAADIWSLGIVLFEVLCGVRVIERIFLPQGLGSAPDKMAIQRIRAGFEEPGSAARHLSGHFRAELSELANGAAQLIDGMLNVNRLHRMDSMQVRQMAGVISQMPL
jgi:serine/threonine protein kinase